MALTSAQKNEIHKRANNGESGSALAKEYGVSASAISNIKNHYTPTEAAPAEVTAAATTKAPAAKKKSAAKVAKTAEATRTVFVSSSNLVNKKFDIPVSSTFGDLLRIAGEDSAVKGVISKAKNKAALEKSTDALPDTEGLPLYIFLVPLKTDAGI